RLRNPLRQAHLQLGRRAVAGAAPDRLADGGHHLMVSMPQDHRPPRGDVVEVVVPIDVDDMAAARLADEERVAADALESAHRTVDAAGDSFYGALVEGARAVGVHSGLRVFRCWVSDVSDVSAVSPVSPVS